MFDNPAQSFCLDGLQLEQTIPVDHTDYTPTGDPLAQVRENLVLRRPLIMVTMADSLTSRVHWANRSCCWVDQAARKIRKHAFTELAVIDPAIGGHQFTHGLTQMVRWLPRCPAPDLITVFFGGNEWSNGMRKAQFKESLRLGVDHIRRVTKGQSEILLMSTVPALTNWESEIREMAEAVREVAREKNTGFADIEEAFRRAGQEEEARKALFAWDEVHLGEFGHQVVAEAVFEAVVGEVPEMQA